MVNGGLACDKLLTCSLYLQTLAFSNYIFCHVLNKLNDNREFKAIESDHICVACFGIKINNL